eukprot:TRINITY_DN19037_c0_g1_i1.p1 TRINITY_DN19037_c0_g1~~TRINITY_DN19037_c0_g1_i1.p1  ORF type:complete len:474 (+),score=89.88 TRINITY_DN19037_c0_g1_i1:3-1424(+)
MTVGRNVKGGGGARSNDVSSGKTAAGAGPTKDSMASALALKLAKTHARAVVRHIYFDFDLTISRIHVFKQVAGWEPGVSPPHASSERGQIHRITELNKAGRWVYDPNLERVVPSKSGGGSWSEAALGGPERVKALRSFLTDLNGGGVKSTIITKGNVGAVRCLLDEVGLLDFFVTVFGMIGPLYGETEYDTKKTERSIYEGSRVNALEGSKAHLILSLMKRDGLEEGAAVLVEDDIQEVNSVRGLCRGLFVSERKGITAGDMETLKNMSGLDQKPFQPGPYPKAQGDREKQNAVPMRPSKVLAPPTTSKAGPQREQLVAHSPSSSPAETGSRRQHRGGSPEGSKRRTSKGGNAASKATDEEDVRALAAERASGSRGRGGLAPENQPPNLSRDSSVGSAVNTPLLAAERLAERKVERRGGAGNGRSFATEASPPRRPIGRHVEPFFLIKLGPLMCSCYNSSAVVDDAEFEYTVE